MSISKRTTTKKAKRKQRVASTKQAEAGVKAAQDVFARFLAKADPQDDHSMPGSSGVVLNRGKTRSTSR